MRSPFKFTLALLASALVVPALGVVTPGGSTIPAASATVRQSGTTELLPPIVQPGDTVARADLARLVGRVTFRPARTDRPVEIQRRVGKDSWQRVAVKRENGNGVVSFTAAARRSSDGRLFTYRGVARRWNGLAMVASNPQSAGVWGQKFSDEFDGPVLDTTKWNYRAPGAYSPQGDRACSASYPDAVEVKDGSVRLYVKADTERDDALGPCTSTNAEGQLQKNTHWYRNGHIGTAQAINDSGSFRYGIAAARVKFDRNIGAHGSFWMQSTVKDRPDVGPAEDGAEIDVVEYFGKEYQDGDVYHFIHYNDADGIHHKVPAGSAATTGAKAARKALTSQSDDWFKSYHVFSVEWTPSAYVFRVDGIRTRTVTEGLSQVPEYLILSMLSSGWEADRIPRETLPNAMKVDWVRYWQK